MYELNASQSVGGFSWNDLWGGLKDRAFNVLDYVIADEWGAQHVPYLTGTSVDNRPETTPPAETYPVEPWYRFSNPQSIAVGAGLLLLVGGVLYVAGRK